MSSPNSKVLSPFAQSALDLDSDFAQMERLSEQLNELDLQTDYGLEQSRKLLQKFSETGERVGAGVQKLATSLAEARVRAEGAAASVSERAQMIQQRHNETEVMLQRFQTLGEVVKKLTAAIGEMRKPDSGAPTEEEKAFIAEQMPTIDSKLAILLDESQKLKDDAIAANMKNLAKNADALNQSLKNARQRLSIFFH